MTLENLSQEQYRKILQEAELAKQDPTRFQAWENDPVGFCRDVLGVKIWSKQVEVLLAVRDSRRVAVRSGHSVGKTFICACLVLWWLYARHGVVITTAPTWEHIETVLWRQIKSLRRDSKLYLPCASELQTEIRVDAEGTWFAKGLSTNQPQAFRGIHDPRLLVVMDEAPGVEETIHTEIGTLATGDENCILKIGNPTDTSGSFYEHFKNPDVWRTMKISCLDHPNVVTGKELIRGAVTTSWVEEKRQEWGEGHPFWYSRVLGDFPGITTRGVIPLLWVERSRDTEMRDRALKQAGEQRVPTIGGLDVARYGDNRCVLTIRRGDAVIEQIAWGHKGLMETTGLAIKAIKDFGLATLVVDSAGLGAGVVDRLLEQDYNVMAYNGGHSAFTKNSFANRRSEMWWHLRERFEKQRLWLPNTPARDDHLTKDLVAPTYELSSAGRIRVETKEKLIERNVKSPDYADSLVLCFAIEEDPAEELQPKPDPAIQDPTQTNDLIIDEEQGPWTTFPADF